MLTPQNSQSRVSRAQPQEKAAARAVDKMQEEAVVTAATTFQRLAAHGRH